MPNIALVMGILFEKSCGLLYSQDKNITLKSSDFAFETDCGRYVLSKTSQSISVTKEAAMASRIGGISWMKIIAAILAISPLCALSQAVSDVTGAANPNQALRDLQQLQHDFDRHRAQKEAENLREKSQGIPDKPQTPEIQKPSGTLSFTLQTLTHTPSHVLSDAEIETVFSQWTGKTIQVDDIARILDEVNALYRKKGYLVCQAVVKPQRISAGHLEITLIEGITDEVTVSGLTSTRESFVTSAFDLKPGEVANYREMIDDLVRFNMVNDVALTVDIRPGKEQYSTSYAIVATEPDRWGVNFFADTVGAKTTGRPRAGASLVNRSVFGRRDSFTLLGLASQGSKSAMASYALPFNSLGTRVSVTGSYGKVDIVDGPSADFDVSGESFLVSLRLEHPFYVSRAQKWTGWLDFGRQKSTTDMFEDVRVADTKIETASVGVDGIALGSQWLALVSADVTHHEAEENTFGNTYGYELLHLNFSGRYTLTNGVMLSATTNAQIKLSGDELVTADHFYLGHVNGVRGYDNDLISAEEGAYLNLEATFPVFGPRASLFVFADVGQLWGESAYSDETLASAGIGVNWPLFENAALRGTVAFPLIRDLDDGQDVNRARFDLSVNVAW